ncbi:U6 snRNA phosphodiesterase 1 [Cylas formicarius]|uniref:U6 snRNA phosphodiesterase 1 n=1 Tax=Cylas formicarius TaxID=197179 RepID=UPI002958B1F5|nr:U6 snRNA phosphodiesterase 1 [Cylas formicarius]
MNKGALALLNVYGGDSSDEEVPGPRVSTKREFRHDSDDASKPSKLPVPREFMDTSVDAENIDNPALHGGRVRSFRHVRGNWATFVYVPVEARAGIDELVSYAESITPPDFGVQRAYDYHISLTKTVILKHHWIKPFVDAIKTTFVGFNKFVVFFDEVRVYSNEEKTRTFLGLQTNSGHDSLVSIVHVLDRCLAEFNLPPFYEDPSFHLSVAWCVGDRERDFAHYLPRINAHLAELKTARSQDNWYILVDRLVCKIGNKMFEFHVK